MGRGGGGKDVDSIVGENGGKRGRERETKGGGHGVLFWGEGLLIFFSLSLFLVTF